MNKSKKHILVIICSVILILLAVIGTVVLIQQNNTQPSNDIVETEPSLPDETLSESLTETPDNTEVATDNTESTSVTEKATEKETEKPTEKPTQEAPTQEVETIDPSTLLRHAPNMYIEWMSSGLEYDAITIDWRCTEDTPCTYWAVHNWNAPDTMGGYAGFQTLEDGKHLILLSLWDLPDGTRPTVEFALNGKYGDFGGEGEGKQVYTEYDWKVNTWYTMKIEQEYKLGKTYFTQYVKEGDGAWLKTACISYPEKYDNFSGSHLFQEDFGFTNQRRSCEVRNAGGKIAGTREWEMWKECLISNSFYPEDGEYGVVQGISNVNFDCDYKNNGISIWIQSGGYDDTPRGKEYPSYEYLK